MRLSVARLCAYCAGFLILVTSAGTQVQASLTPAAAPEIDGSVMTVGLGLLAGAVLILRSRRRSK
jgi:hypothetical protein